MYFSWQDKENSIGLKDGEGVALGSKDEDGVAIGSKDEDVVVESSEEESESEEEWQCVDDCVKCLCEDECELGFMIQVITWCLT